MSERTIRTRSGHVITTSRTDQEALDLLKSAVADGRAISKFARELAGSQIPLSEEQMRWVHVLVADELGEATDRPIHRVTDHSKLVALLEAAAERGIKRPSIRCDGATAKRIEDGAILVKDGHGYVGRLRPDGLLVGAPGNAGRLKAAAAALSTFAEDPVGHARLYGHRVGRCCFCGLTLTTGESLFVGYGPICADKYGLPWGEKDPISAHLRAALDSCASPAEELELIRRELSK